MKHIRSVLLAAIDKHAHDQNLQSRTVLKEAQQKLGIDGRSDEALALLESYQDLFRTGYLCWGHNIDNPEPPFFHLTSLGREALKTISRDPANPEGYVAYLESQAKITPLARSYVEEALHAYNAACPKASAVMIGAASEATVNKLVEIIVRRLNKLGQTVPAALKSWKAKKRLDAVDSIITLKKSTMPRELRERFEAHWNSFLNQIRLARNDAGHPNSLDPVSETSVHASLLMFPELAKLATDLGRWFPKGYK